MGRTGASALLAVGSSFPDPTETGATVGTRLEVAMLGGFRVTFDGRPVALRYTKSKAVLAKVQTAARPVARSTLASLLWPQLPGDRSKANLRVVLADLRASVPGVASIDAQSVSVAAGATISSDVDRLFALRDGGHPAPSDEELLQFLTTAGGHFLEGVNVPDAPEFEAWVREMDVRVGEAAMGLFTSAVQSLTERVENETMPPHQLMRALRAARASYPESEQVLRLVMRTMDQLGRGNSAVDEYRTFRGRSQEFAGPSEPETLHLVRSIAQHMHPHDDLMPPLSGPGRVPPVVPLFGRDADVATVMDRFERGRLVTITGMGGVGKTALAHAIGENVGGSSGHSAYFCAVVDLSGARPGDDLAVTLTAGLGLTVAGLCPPDDELAMALRRRQLLLILDTGDHVAGSLGHLVTKLLSECPALRLLVTSRSPLHLEPEQVVYLSPLPVPAPDASPDSMAENPGVRLVIERARAIGAAIDTAPDVAAIGELCRKLEGIPLALELVAIQMRLLSPAELAATPDTGILDLHDGSGQCPDRHRTLSRSIAWSYDLLDNEQQRMLRALSVFRGGAPVSAVEGLLGDGPSSRPAIIHLLEASLVRRAVSPGGSRLMLPAPIRVCAQELLVAAGESALVERRHASIFAVYAELADGGLRGNDQNEWLARLDLDHENLVAALETLLATRATRELLKMTLALSWFWHIHGLSGEGRGWLDRACELGLADAAGTGGNADVLSLVGRAETMSALLSLGAHDERSASDCLVLARQAFGRCHDPEGEGKLAHVEVLQQLHAAVGPLDPGLVGHIGRSTRTAEAYGATWDAARRRYTEAWVHIRTRAFEEAEQSGTHSRESFRELGNRWGVATGTLVVAIARGLQGDWSSATAELPGSYRVLYEVRDLTHCFYALSCGAGAFAMTGHPARAARLYGAACTVKEETGLDIPAAFRAVDATMRATARSQLSHARWMKEWEQGAREGLDVTW